MTTTRFRSIRSHWNTGILINGILWLLLMPWANKSQPIAEHPFLSFYAISVLFVEAASCFGRIRRSRQCKQMQPTLRDRFEVLNWSVFGKYSKSDSFAIVDSLLWSFSVLWGYLLLVNVIASPKSEKVHKSGQTQLNLNVARGRRRNNEKFELLRRFYRRRLPWSF